MLLWRRRRQMSHSESWRVRSSRKMKFTLMMSAMQTEDSYFENSKFAKSQRIWKLGNQSLAVQLLKVTKPATVPDCSRSRLNMIMLSKALGTVKQVLCRVQCSIILLVILVCTFGRVNHHSPANYGRTDPKVAGVCVSHWVTYTADVSGKAGQSPKQPTEYRAHFYAQSSPTHGNDTRVIKISENAKFRAHRDKRSNLEEAEVEMVEEIPLKEVPLWKKFFGKNSKVKARKL